MSLPHGDVDLEAHIVQSGDNEAVVTVRDITERLTLQCESLQLKNGSAAGSGAICTMASVKS